MDDLIRVIDSGKVRGYCESRLYDGRSYFFQYAIRRRDDQYFAYYFSVDESKMDVFEDYAYEELKQFGNATEAFDFLIEKGADITKFRAFKGVSPL